MFCAKHREQADNIADLFPQNLEHGEGTELTMPAQNCQCRVGLEGQTHRHGKGQQPVVVIYGTSDIYEKVELVIDSVCPMFFAKIREQADSTTAGDPFPQSLEHGKCRAQRKRRDRCCRGLRDLRYLWRG